MDSEFWHHPWVVSDAHNRKGTHNPSQNDLTVAQFHCISG